MDTVSIEILFEKHFNVNKELAFERSACHKRGYLVQIWAGFNPLSKPHTYYRYFGCMNASKALIFMYCSRSMNSTVCIEYRSYWWMTWRQSSRDSGNHQTPKSDLTDGIQRTRGREGLAKRSILNCQQTSALERIMEMKLRKRMTSSWRWPREAEGEGKTGTPSRPILERASHRLPPNLVGWS